MLKVLERGACLGGQGDARVQERVRSGHRPALAHGETDRRGAARERAVPDFGARARQHHEVSGVEADPVERGHGGAEEPAHAFDDALSDFVGLEGLRDEPAHFGEDFGLAPAALRLGEQMRVADRDRGVVGQAAERSLVTVGERTCRPIEDVQQALELPVLDGNDDLRDDAHGLDPVGVVPGDPRILGVVRRPERPSGGQDEPAGALSGLDQETDERVIRRCARAAPVDHPNAVGAGLSQGDLGTVGAGELAGAGDDPREDGREVERAVDLADDFGEHVHLAAAPGRVVEKLNALEHECRLIGEGLGQPDLALHEDPAFVVAHRERADHPVLDQERQREDRPVGGAFEALEDRRVVLDARVVGEVRGRDRPAIARGETHHPGAARKDRSGAERLFPLAHERERGQISGFGNEPVEGRLLGAEQGPDALHHAPRDRAKIERLAAQAAQLRQGLGRAAAPLALGKEPTVADRGAGLRDQGLEDLVSVALEVEGLLGHQHEDTDDRLLIQDRQRVQTQETVGGIPVAREHRRFAKVVGLDGLVMERHPAGDPLTVREARPGMPRADRRIGARAELDRASRLVGDPEGHAASVGEPDRRRGDLAEDLIGVEGGGDELDELDQGAQLARERFGRIDSRFHARSLLGPRAIHYPKLRRPLVVRAAGRREAGAPPAEARL